MLYLYILLELFTSYSNDTYSRKYEKLPNIVIHACYRTLMDFLKKCGPQIWLCLFMFRPITFEQLKNRWPRCKASDCAARGSGFNSRLWLRFLCLPFCFVVVVIWSFVQKHIIYMKCCNSFCNVNSFHLLNILHNLWPINTIGIKYWPNIFKIYFVHAQDEVKWCFVFSSVSAHLGINISRAAIMYRLRLQGNAPFFKECTYFPKHYLKRTETMITSNICEIMPILVK